MSRLARSARPWPDGSTIELGIKRSAEMAAVFMIGDGVLGLLQPERHVGLWRSDVGAIDFVVRPFDRRPGRRRAYGLLQLAAGIGLAAILRRGERVSASPTTDGQLEVMVPGGGT